MKLKVEFNKYQKTGQNIFERSLTVDALNLLLIMSDEVQVHHSGKKKTGELLFIFHGEFNRYARVKNVKLYILKKFLPEDQWTDKMEKGKKR